MKNQTSALREEGANRRSATLAAMREVAGGKRGRDRRASAPGTGLGTPSEEPGSVKDLTGVNAEGREAAG